MRTVIESIFIYSPISLEHLRIVILLHFSRLCLILISFLILKFSIFYLYVSFKHEIIDSNFWLKTSKFNNELRTIRNSIAISF